MLRVGALLDRVALWHYGMAACLGLTLAALLTAFGGHVALLALALFLLRLSGQGMMSHAASTSMARFFGRHRGKAISLAALGHPLGEAVLPTLTVALMAALGWRDVWLLAAAVVAFAVAPATVLLLRRAGDAGRRAAASGAYDFSLRGFFGQRRGLLMLPGLMAPGFINTGIFFHQTWIAEARGWALSWIALCFVGYAAASVGAMLLGGLLVDRFTARRLMPFYLLPLAAGCLVLAAVPAPWAAAALMLLLGTTQGLSFTVVTAVWAELYGATYLGSIRAAVTAVAVISTALAPGLLGLLFDGGVSVAAVAGGCGLYALAGATLMAGLFRRPA